MAEGRRQEDLQLTLVPMDQLAEALDREDDWTGLTDAKGRRRRQNRLNQRAYRRRRANAEGLPIRETPTPQPESTHQPPPQLQLQQHHLPSYTNNPLPPPAPTHQQPSCTTTPSQQLIHATASSLLARCRSTSPFPNPLYFPLTPDHLLPLIQYNVLRAVLTNYFLFTSLPCVPPTCTDSRQVTPLPPPNALPPALSPTALQQVTPHPLWMDLFPLPAMRDNLIAMAGYFDEDELCADLVGGIFDEPPPTLPPNQAGEQDEQSESNGYTDQGGGRQGSDGGLVAWSDPWDIGGWELTEGFVRKWGFLLRGCGEIIEVTNRWRAVRDEEPLVVEV